MTMEHQTHEKILEGAGVLLLVAGVFIGYWYGYPKGISAGVLQEKAAEEARKQQIVQYATNTVSFFQQPITNPLELSPTYAPPPSGKYHPQSRSRWQYFVANVLDLILGPY